MRTRSSGPRRNRAGNESARRFLRRPRSRAVAVAIGGAVAVAAAVAGLTAAGLTSGARSASVGVGHTAAVARATRPRPGPRPAGAGPPASSRSRAGSGAHPAKRAAARAKTPRTSCRSVAHIGDSTSVDLISPDYLPNPAQRLGARYAAVGVRHLKIDASGGRSIVEEMPGQINGYKVASAWRSQGYRGCWVFALGTNDSANVASGSAVGMMARIDQMMSVAHGEPVLWVNTRTLLSSGPWAGVNEQTWDKTLVRALAKYPDMRIFNWSAVARPSWFLTDGIHYNSFGCAMRAKAIAEALARAFPLNGRGADKIVR
ncbi:MAG TPA: hypothetical protein VEM58_08995 [Streptosporangiaceae bacterium]|nr:hypothetical protein [Streptosporangiaceae bacterium]